MDEKRGVVIFIFVLIAATLIFLSSGLTGNVVLGQEAVLLFELDPNDQDIGNKIIEILDAPKIIDDANYGKVYSFDGTGYLKTKEKLSPDINKGFSVSVIAYIEDNEEKNHMSLVATELQDFSRGFRIKYRDFPLADRLYVHLGGLRDFGDYEGFEDGLCYKKWCHYAFTYFPNGKTVIYLNGNKMNTIEANKGIIFDDQINIGNDVNLNKIILKGKIANVQIYEGVLSSKDIEEIKSLYIK